MLHASSFITFNVTVRVIEQFTESNIYYADHQLNSKLLISTYLYMITKIVLFTGAYVGYVGGFLYAN